MGYLKNILGKQLEVCHHEFVFYVLHVFVGQKQSSPTVQPSSQGDERDTISPTPLMGSNKLGMASGWSSAFETQTAVHTVDGNTNEADHVGPLPGPREPQRQVTHTKLQNVPSFGTLLKDYTVQGPNRFEAPVYAEGEVPIPPAAQQVESDVNIIPTLHCISQKDLCSKQTSLITLVSRRD